MSRTNRRALKHRLEYELVRLARAMDRTLGARLSGWLAARLGYLAYYLGIRRALAEENLRHAFPERDAAWIARTARAAYGHLGREGLSLLRLSRLRRGDVVAVTRMDQGLEELQAAVEEGRGAVVVTGHLGNWEIGGAALAARGIPLDVVARPQSNPLVDDLINRARFRLGMTVIPRARATRESLRTLKQGRVIALVADQNAHGAGIPVPFMHRPASTYRGPAVLALRSGAPLFIGTALRRGGGYSVQVERVPVPAAGSHEEQVARLTAAHVAALEAAVREAPEQYLWQHRRWKAPPGNGGAP